MQRAPQEVRTYFVTSVIAQRRRILQTDTNCELFLHVLQDCREKRRMLIHAFVCMPDHFHAVITPAEDVSLEKAMQFIKGGFSFRLKSKLDVWERGYNETNIRDRERYEITKRYIEANPVRKGMVERASDFRFSSASVPMDECPGWL